MGKIGQDLGTTRTILTFPFSEFEPFMGRRNIEHIAYNGEPSGSWRERGWLVQPLEYGSDNEDACKNK